MTFALRSIRRLPRPALQRSATISTTSRLRIKEDADRSPEDIEKKKNEQIQKQKEGKGHWHEELASAGESNIAADKEKVHDHGEHMEDLQKQTAGQAEDNHPHSKKN